MLFRKTLCGILLVQFSSLLPAQAPPVNHSSRPTFEVASIRPAAPYPVLVEQIRSGVVHPGIRIQGNRFDSHTSLETLIAIAFGINNDRIVGPDWLNSQRFEIHALLSDGNTKDQVPEMLQALLEDRFKLRAHFENKEQPVYALIVARDGPKIVQAEDVSAFFDGAKPVTANSPILTKQESDGVISMDRRTGMVTKTRTTTDFARKRMEILSTPMSALAEYLTFLMDHPVLDKTNLRGSYKLTLEFPREVLTASYSRRIPADVVGATPFSDPSGAATGAKESPNAALAQGELFQAIQKVGLKLERRRAPVKTLVLDHVEKNPVNP